MRNIDAIFSTVHIYSPTAVIETKSSIVFELYLRKEPIQCRIEYMNANFEINIGSMITLCKIEEQNIEANVINDLINTFFQAINKKQVTVHKYNFFAFKIYDIVFKNRVSNALPFIQYESIAHAVIKKIAKSKLLGTLQISNLTNEAPMGKRYILAAKRHDDTYDPVEVSSDIHAVLENLEYGDVLAREYQLWEYPSGKIFNITPDRELSKSNMHYFSTPFTNKGVVWQPIFNEVDVDASKVAQAKDYLL